VLGRGALRRQHDHNLIFLCRRAVWIAGQTVGRIVCEHSGDQSCGDYKGAGRVHSGLDAQRDFQLR
jgi:hypothetical protein